ncbi:MAG: hypothetical protein C5B51_01265 [Terriglobia bacterium]|nr:MAG: hypothetical protein C5B51_01265 [Terriglobia bacterium]
MALILAAPAFAQEPATPPAAPAEKTESPAPPTEQWLTGSVDFGYRWLTDIRGSLASYRSVINLGEGPKLFGLDFTVQDPKKRLFDRMDVRAYGWGGDPYNTAHLSARKSGVYDLSADYRNIAYFNALPSFANPFVPAGFNERSFDIHRRMADVDLEFFPGKHIIPYLAFSRNAGYGHGVETWLVDAANEYAVPTLLRDSTNNYRGGLRVEYNRFHVTLEEGGTTFKDDSQGYDSQANKGDRTTPLNGQTLVLNKLQQSYAIRGDSIYSRGLVTATPASWVTFSGQLLYSQPKTDVRYSDTAAGNLAVLNVLYSGLSDVATGTAKQPHITGNAGAEVRPWRRIRIVEAWTTDRYHDASVALFSTLLGTARQQTSSSPDLQIVNYNQEQVDVMFDATPRITMRGGYRHVWGDATVRAGQLSQTGNFAAGQLRRDVGLAGATFRPHQKLRVNLDYEGGVSDAVYFRTSLNDYHRARARAQYQATASLAFQFNFRLLNTQNPAPSVRYDFQSQDESLSIFWTPNNGKRVSFNGEYDHWALRSDASYFSLPFLSPTVSAYRENAHTASGSAGAALPGYHGLTPHLEAGGSLFISSGSRPSRFYQPLVRLSLPLGKHVSWNTEWRWYGLGERFYLYEGFRTHAFITGLRVTR